MSFLHVLTRRLARPELQMAPSRPLKRLLLRSLSSVDACSGRDIRQDGAWTLLAALEKAKEADNVQVAHLLSSLGYLLQQQPDEVSTQHTFPLAYRSSDPAFFSIPDATVSPDYEWTKQDVLGLLQSSLRGRRIDLGTVEALLIAAARHFGPIPSVVTLPPLGPQQHITVVGDLHGSLTDLNTVLGLVGTPSAQHQVVFNGDLADRGDHGVEVISIVCALILAYPQYVHLNRGNHEDLTLSVAYGLATEIQHKYGTATFRQRLSGLLDAFFRSLPLVTVVRNDALIVHAGPPPPGWTIDSIKDQLATVDRPLASRTSRVGGKPGTDVELLLESILWSDPDVDEKEGTLVNYVNEEDHLKPNRARGAGFKFDATIVQGLLQSEGLKRLIRSHEPVHKGCARYTVCNQTDMELFTVFSASRYPYKQGFNYGAILQLHPNNRHKILRYATEEDEPISDSASQQEPKPPPKIDTVDSGTLRKALRRAVALRRAELERAFDKAGDDILFSESVGILVQALRLEGEGLSQPAPMLALAQALTEEDEIPESLDILGVLDAWSDQEDDDDDANSQPIATGWLKAIFAMVDANHDNIIDKQEWSAAVNSMNAKLPEGLQKIDIDATWSIIDRNGDGSVSVAEWSTLAAIHGR